MDPLLIAFWGFGAWAIGSGLVCITRRSPVAAALWLVSTMFALAGMFVLLHAHFLAAVQVIVYAGAVMVLFLFVIMLLNLDAEQVKRRRAWVWVVGVGLGAVMAAQLVTLGRYSPERLAGEFSTMPSPDPALVFAEGMAVTEATAARGVVGAIGEPLFTAYLIPFEVTGVLLLTAVIGAIVLAKRRL